MKILLMLQWKHLDAKKIASSGTEGNYIKTRRQAT
jgi:hypothetical protein